ncbi:MAG: dihydropteroate synthase [Chthoniobacter sp.]|jgi:dihydropteroate synthase|nr:dihydropteroate synthase [Chthoniobacter sp.]
MILRTRRRAVEIRRPLIMGIVNLCADSFSGDGIGDCDAAILHAQTLIADGADIIDIGAESAGTGRSAMSGQRESDRLSSFIEKFLRSESAGALLSVNTWRPEVAATALAVGGDILNDIGALPTDENAKLCAKHGAALLIMHSVGAPKVPHIHICHDDVMAALDVFFTQKIALAEAAGVPREAIIVDPGIDFAKQRSDNLRIYRDGAQLRKFGRPILLPISRKTVIGEVLNIREPRERDAGTIACLVGGMIRGAAIFRTHNVRAASAARALICAIEEMPESPAV